MAHPYASQAKASQKRRLSALNAKAGKSFGSSSMYKKTSYPSKNAGTERPMTISGKSAKKRADQPAKYASGGVVTAGGPSKATKKKPAATTNIIIANNRGGGRGNRNRGNRPPMPVAVPRPVPVPVPVGGAPGGPPAARPPIVIGGGGGGPGPMLPPGGPPPGLPVGGPPPGMARPPGLASGGLATGSHPYRNWGEGYKAGGVVKKSGGMVKLANMGEANDGSPMKKKHYTFSKKADGGEVEGKKDGGGIEKKAIGGGMMKRGMRPAGFKPGAVPGQPVVPLSGAKRPMSPVGGLGLKDGGNKKADGGTVGGFTPTDQNSKDPALEDFSYRNQGTGFNKGGSVKKAGSGSGLGRKAKIAAAKAVPADTEV